MGTLLDPAGLRNAIAEAQAEFESKGTRALNETKEKIQGRILDASRTGERSISVWDVPVSGPIFEAVSKWLAAANVRVSKESDPDPRAPSSYLRLSW